MYVYENHCVPTIKSTSVAIVGGALQITIPNVSKLNGKRWNLIICQAIPSNAGTLPVQIISNGLNYPILSNLGNTLRADMIRPRKRYTIAYGWDKAHFIVLSHDLCESAFIPSTAASPTTVSAAVEPVAKKEEKAAK